MEIQINGSEGAILICDDHTREGIQRNIGELKNWGTANVNGILHLERETRDFGFFIVTAIRRTKRYRLKCWSRVLSLEPEGINISSAGVDLSGWVVPPADVDQVSFFCGSSINTSRKLYENTSFS